MGRYLQPCNHISKVYFLIFLFSSISINTVLRGFILSYTKQKKNRVDNGVGFRWVYTQYRPKLLVGSYALPESRTTYELKGLRIVMSIHGTMYRFSWVGLILSFGSVVALTVTANAATDFILLNIHPDRQSYVLQKYRFVQDWRIIDDVRNQLRKHLTNLGYY